MDEYIEIWREEEIDSIFEFILLCKEAFREVQGQKKLPRWFWNKYWLAKNKEIIKKEMVSRLKELFDEREYPEEETSGYDLKPHTPKPLVEQIERISDLFHLSKTRALGYIKNLPAVPDGADHFYAIPSSKAMFPNEKLFLAQYLKAIEFAVSALGIECPWNMNWTWLTIDPTVENFIHKLEQDQGKIFIVPIGHRHQGRSCRRAKQFFLPNELPIWLLAGISISETNPELFKAATSCLTGRKIICGGDNFYPGNPYIVDLRSEIGEPGKSWISGIGSERQADTGNYCLTVFDL